MRPTDSSHQAAADHQHSYKSKKMKERIKFIQESLKKGGFRINSIDGIWGSETASALMAYHKILRSPAIGWPIDRQIMAGIQNILREKGLDPGPVDGFWGPSTEFAFDQAMHPSESSDWRDGQVEEDLSIENPNGWPNADQTSLIEFYGQPGDSSNLTQIELPFPMRIAWNPSQVVTKTTVHKKCAESLLRILNEILDHYGLDEIQRLRIDHFGGVYNVRKKRGGSTWSSHAFAAAIDLDPANNKLRMKAPEASFSQSPYIPMIKAFESEGWTSLGRAKNYDWMHFQATA